MHRGLGQVSRSTQILGPLRILDPLRILGPITKKYISRSNQKYQREQTQIHENRLVNNRKSNPLMKYAKRYIPNQTKPKPTMWIKNYEE